MWVIAVFLVVATFHPDVASALVPAYPKKASSFSSSKTVRHYAPDAVLESRPEQQQRQQHPTTIHIEIEQPPRTIKRSNNRAAQPQQRRTKQTTQVRPPIPSSFVSEKVDDYDDENDDNEDEYEAWYDSDFEPRSNKGLLSKEEEARYALALRTMRQAIRVRDQLVRHQDGFFIHPTEQAWAAACGCSSIFALRHLMQQGQEARATLVKANVGLVTSIAKKHYTNLKFATRAGAGSVGTILTLHDMVQEGNLGLMEAAERFEPEKGFRFSTYAVWWIRQRIMRSISDSSRTIRLPAHVHGMLHKMRKARNELLEAKRGGAALSPEGGSGGGSGFWGGPCSVSAQEVAQHLGVSEEKVRKYTESSRNVVSLEVPICTQMRTHKPDDSNVRTLGDTLASDAPTPDEDVEWDFLRQDLSSVMEQELSDVERNVILHRFGFMDHGVSGKTVAETATALKISSDRVRMIEARALNKLRHPQRNYRLREYVAGGGSRQGSGGNRKSGGLIKQRRSMRRISTPTSTTRATTTSTSEPTTTTSTEKITTHTTKPRTTPVLETTREKPHSSRTAKTTAEEETPISSRSPPTMTAASTPRPDRMWFF